MKSRAKNISDTDVEIFYLLHRQRLRRPETRRLRHILITLNDDYPDNRRPRVEARLAAMRHSLLDDPGSFAELALKHSECPTALHQGLIGAVPRGQLYPELDAVAFALQAGELSAITESPMGLHLLLCEAIEAERELSLDEAAPFIRRHLEQGRRLRPAA